jgi:hypothetical protein
MRLARTLGCAAGLVAALPMVFAGATIAHAGVPSLLNRVWRTTCSKPTVAT